jgi:multiple sugar transport system substrate-binding protein
MHLGMGGTFFAPGTAEPAINNEAGVATLTMLKELVAYSNPDFLTFDSNATQALWESGNLALATMWGSRAGAILDAEGATPEIVAATALAAAPTVGGGSIPATTLWWDGFTIAKNVSDADAEASFIAMMNGITPEVIAANNDAAVWLGAGLHARSGGGGRRRLGRRRGYPLSDGALHGADAHRARRQPVGVPAGSESAEQALADAEAAYTAAAKEQGFLN